MAAFRHFFFLLLLSTFPAISATSDKDGADQWSSCECPAKNPTYNAGEVQRPSARIAYLISVHNRRTIEDGAYLLKALMETSYPGDISIILIHVDKRVGIASRDSETVNKDRTNQFLYDDSSLRKYVDACTADTACTRNNRESTNARARNDGTILEVHSHYSPEWSQWSMNDPTLWAMDYLVHNTKLSWHQGLQPWDVFINLSGDSMPVLTAHRISQLFEPEHGPLGNTNFVTSASCVTGLVPTSIFDFPEHTMKRAHYFQRKIPKKLSYVDFSTGKWRKDVETPIYFGSQWMALTYDFVEYVVRSMDHPNGLGNVLKEALIDSQVLMTDETFFATMLMNSPVFKDTVPSLNDDGAFEAYPSLYSVRYERMDENAPNAWGKYTSSNSLYDITAKFKEVTDGEGPARPWGPYFLGTYDLGAIRDSGALFVRKVSWTVDKNLIRMLPIKIHAENDQGILEWEKLPDIRWPELGVNIRDPFVWSIEEKDAEKE